MTSTRSPLPRAGATAGVFIGAERRPLERPETTTSAQMRPHYQALDDAAKERQREHGGTAPGKRKSSDQNQSSQKCEECSSPGPRSVNERLAKMADIAPGQLQAAINVVNKAPELIPAVMAKEINVGSSFPALVG